MCIDSERKTNTYKVMKANEAPEKIYLDEDKSWHLTNPNGDSVEYIRADAFIEKAAKWINEHTSLSEKLVIENFRKYMEGE